MRCLVTIVVAVFLVGCAHQSPEEQAQAKAAAQASQAAEDNAKCQAAGYHPGTPDFEKCLAKMADKHAQDDYYDRAALAARLQGRLPGTPGLEGR